MARKRKKRPAIHIELNARTLASVVLMLCSAYIALMPADSPIWSGALGLQGFLTSFLAKRDT